MIDRVIATAEYELLREAAGLVDRSYRGKLRLTGGEAADYLQGQVTNDVEALEPGHGCYATLLTPKGQIVADMRILREEDALWVDAEPRSMPALVRNASMYGIGRDVHTADVTDEFAILSLIGPGARAALDSAPPEEEHAWVAGEHGMYVATDLGVDVICPAADAEGVRVALGVEPVSEEAAECVRIESGRPRLGYEIAGGRDPAGGRAQRARGELHEGLLRRAGDCRAAALQGQAEPPPARTAALAAGRLRRGGRLRRQRRRQGRHGRRIARPRADRACDPPPGGRARGPGSRWAPAAPMERW